MLVAAGASNRPRTRIWSSRPEREVRRRVERYSLLTSSAHYSPIRCLNHAHRRCTSIRYLWAIERPSRAWRAKRREIVRFRHDSAQRCHSLVRSGAHRQPPSLAYRVIRSTPLVICSLRMYPNHLHTLTRPSRNRLSIGFRASFRAAPKCSRANSRRPRRNSNSPSAAQ